MAPLAAVLRMSVVLHAGFGSPPEVTPTWSADVASIVHARCSDCHRPGGGAPFSLLTYDDAKRKARTIAAVVEHGQMPPWPSSQGSDVFRAARKLSQPEMDTLMRWAEGDAPAGELSKAPSPPTYSSTWSLGVPDIEVETKDSFRVPASGRDIYKYFTIPLNIESERWLSAIDVQSNAPAVVHHALFFLDDSNEERGSDRGTSLGGWAVGMRGQRMPLDLGQRVPAGSNLVMQVHFHPSGKAEDVTVRVGMWFCAKKPERTLVEFQLPAAFGRLAGIDIPAGDPAWTLQDAWTIPADIDLVSVWAHAHTVCVSARAVATLPDGSERILLDIPAWSFNWQLRYDYCNPVRLPKGTRIESELIYDNSASNPNNPYTPPQRVTWGEQTSDEMGSLIFNATPVQEADLAVLGSSYTAHVAASSEGVGARTKARLIAGAKRFDKNGDRALDTAEIPARWRKRLLALDLNKDGVVTFEELEAILVTGPQQDRAP